MHVAIIGAGISGLTLARALAHRKISYTLYERRNQYARAGLGLLLLPNGMAALDEVGLGDEIRQLSNPLDLAVMRTIHGKAVAQFPLNGHRGIARIELLTRLQRGVSEATVRWGRAFESLTSVNPVVAIVGGEEIRADLLVAADGARSTVRAEVAPSWRLAQCPVSELVSVCDTPDLAALYDRTFVKHLAPGERLAVGLLPGAQGRMVWFVQFDANQRGAVPSTARGKKRFVRRLVGEWADPIPELVERTDFTNTHLWRTPAPGIPAPMVNGRVVLIGDAAHPFPTLTSQGANAAMVDAVVLARHLDEAADIDEALRKTDEERAPRLEQIRQGGIKLVEAFCSSEPITGLPMVH